MSEIFGRLLAARDGRYRRKNDLASALLLVDLQNDFCAEGGLAWKHVEDKAALKSVLMKAVHLTVEAHKIGVPCFFVRSYFDKKYKLSTLIRKHSEYGIVEDICCENSWGADFCGVKPDVDDIVINKHTDDSFLYTYLEPLLRNYGVNTIVLAGVFTEICILETAKSAFRRGFEVVLPADCIAGLTQRCATTAMLEMNALGMTLLAQATGGTLSSHKTRRTVTHQPVARKSKSVEQDIFEDWK